MLLDIARETIERHHLLQRGDRVLVAVSGGPDSVALLDVLIQLRPEYELDLHVAHLNHRLRPEADEEADFVAALAAERGLPCVVEAANVRAIAARRKLSIEHAARIARQRFLLRAARRARAARIALGHHADDRVETVLLNIMRGAGVDGLAGIRPVGAAPWWHRIASCDIRRLKTCATRRPPGGRAHGRAPTTLIRPLLDATRAHIMEHIRQRGLPCREDPSNRDPAFLRNRVRHELLPLLEDLRPGCKQAILRLAELAAEDSASRIAETNAALAPMILERTRDSIVLRLKPYSSIPSSGLRQRVLREAMRGLLGDLNDLEQVHFEAARRLADNGKPGARISLPRRVIIERGYRTLILRLGDIGPLEPVGEFVLTAPGVTEVRPLMIRVGAEILARKEAPSPSAEPANAAQFEYTAIAEPIILRTWRRGDRFQPLGMTGTMKVHDLFVNQKVPRAERQRVPIIVSGERIMWVVGHRVDDRFKVTAATETVLRLEAGPAR